MILYFIFWSKFINFCFLSGTPKVMTEFVSICSAYFLILCSLNHEIGTNFVQRLTVCQVMANVDFLYEFSRIVDAFKAEHEGCLVPAVIPLKSVLSFDQRKWFGKFFRKQAHKDWLEHVCHMP